MYIDYVKVDYNSPLTVAKSRISLGHEFEIEMKKRFEPIQGYKATFFRNEYALDGSKQNHRQGYDFNSIAITSEAIVFELEGFKGEALTHSIPLNVKRIMLFEEKSYAGLGILSMLFFEYSFKEVYGITTYGNSMGVAEQRYQSMDAKIRKGWF